MHGNVITSIREGLINFEYGKKGLSFRRYCPSVKGNMASMSNMD